MLRLTTRALLWCGALLLAGCTTPPPLPPPPDRPPDLPATEGSVLTSSASLLIYLPGRRDSWAGLARRFLGDATQAWQIEELNPPLQPGVPVLIPLQPWNPVGMTPQGLRQITLLCYHRFAPGHGRRGSRMQVSAGSFAEQLRWLADNGYQVLSLARLEEILAGHRPVPPRAVVITADDGYDSFHRIAFPLLKQHGYPATVFVYTDFIGSGDALSWAQMKEMLDSGLIDIQAHSRSHANLTVRQEGESDARYRQRLEAEIRTPRDLLQRRLAPLQVRHYAYPFGDANTPVLDVMRRERYLLGVTVRAGGTPFHAQPLYLRRTMIYGDQDLDEFRRRLQPLQPLPSTGGSR